MAFKLVVPDVPWKDNSEFTVAIVEDPQWALIIANHFFLKVIEIPTDDMKGENNG